MSYDIYSDERDKYGQRMRVMSGAKPGLVTRLNAGIYSIVGTYGDANAIARADVTVEAGKLTEATLTHAAARVTFKLVTRAGGDAIGTGLGILRHGILARKLEAVAIEGCGDLFQVLGTGGRGGEGES